jgi:nitrogen-specific signal transduction histidine kinase
VPVPLTSLAYQRLFYLVQNAGHALPAQLLPDRLWRPDYGATRDSLKVCISRLSAKIDPRAATHPIETPRDAGGGIPAADLPHVFDRFRRGGTVPGQVAGTGIGLAGVKQIVEQHGGRITLESREGHGTTVAVRLPLAAPGASPDRAETRGVASPSS